MSQALHCFGAGILQPCSLHCFPERSQGYRAGCYEQLGVSSKMCSSAFRWALSAYTWLSSGKTYLSEHISLGRAFWCSWWSLGHNLLLAKADDFIQPGGSHHHLHWFHQKHFHLEFAHLEHMEAPTPSAGFFCDVLPYELGWVLQVIPPGHQKGLGLPRALRPVC